MDAVVTAAALAAVIVVGALDVMASVVMDGVRFVAASVVTA